MGKGGGEQLKEKVGLVGESYQPEQLEKGFKK